MATMTEDKQAPAFHVLSVIEALQAEQVDQRSGLSSEEATKRRSQHGPNKFAETKKEPWWRSFVRQYADPMQLVLLAAGIGSLFPLKQWGTGVLLIALTLLNAALGLHQEGKAAAAIDALQKMMIIKTKVRRDGTLTELAAEELVPGDVVLVEAGDVVPADGRLLRAAMLEIDESALTGESLPVAKNVEAIAKVDTDLGDRADMAYMNTNVTRGSGELVVTATGMTTEVGRISGMLQTEKDAETPLTRQLAKLTNQILIVAGIALFASVVINLARGNSFNVVFTAAIAFAISAIPTGLPAVVTTILSLGTQLLARANAIVKRLRSTETLGSTSAINSDKTGTLTLNQMTATEMTIPGRRYLISGGGYATDGVIKRVAGQPEVPLEPFLLPMILASDAVVRDGKLIGDPTEGALVVLAEKGGLDAEATRERYPRVAELPFDAAYKMMATFHRMDGVIRCFVKGAPDQLLMRAGQVPGDDLTPVPVDDAFRVRYLAENTRLAQQGLRVMATGSKDFDPETFDPGGDLLAMLDGLTVLTLVGIVDPPRPQAQAAIEQAHAAGIEVRMITGDHAVTAAAIAGKLGIRGRAITGAEFAAMSDEEADREIGGIGVIARVTPEHKVRLVEVLKRKGHIVAMTGDGVNDAPALKKADIGIAMGITGTEVSKEAAAMILTDDDFATIVKAVELGRALYANLKKYIFFQMGVLAAMIVTFLSASIFNIAAGVPFVPLQTLWLNFTTQVFQSVGLGYGKAEPDIMRRPPRRSDEPLLTGRALGWLGIVGLIMGVATLVLIWAADREYGVEVARTMGLTSFSIANLVFSFTVRSDIRSVFSLETFGDRRFLITTGMSVAAILLATELGLFQRILQTTSLNLGQWAVCLLVGLVVIVPTELRKIVLRRKAGVS
ncbi:cation-translocating P-type ATPase [Paractinoplanes brasiliensis]|uniref:Ca2+-transporting ATPase n=1 Tax=Paractinoplanes brasiliensis TaxID=52695 RepID=A0A4R6J7F6_9ACTN|nr:HAD-IC family P-type ATPase [Actinoplanes brasiliensis]TDO31454.1 Ca2+-transporting ATPase [Actinoplanes brasiliensis]GID30850.1 ATPase [Actinoplanes brasiliensis]